MAIGEEDLKKYVGTKLASYKKPKQAVQKVREEDSSLTFGQESLILIAALGWKCGREMITAKDKEVIL